MSARPPPGSEPPRSEPPRFEPKKLSRETVDVPIATHWKDVSPEDAERFHAKALAEHRKFASSGPRMRRRLVRYVLYGAIGYPLFGWLFTVPSPGGLLLFLAMGAVAGALVAWLRTGDFATGLILGGTIFAAMSVTTGGSVIRFLLTASACMLFGSIGILIGRVEEWKRLDGED